MGEQLRVKQSAGAYNQPMEFWSITDQVDLGAVSRVPTLAWKMSGKFMPFQGLEQQSVGAMRVVGEVWATIAIPFFPSRIPREGWTIKLVYSGSTDDTRDEYEIRGVLDIDGRRQELALTCRLVR